MPSPSVSIADMLIIRGALLVMTCGVQYGFSYQISSVMLEPSPIRSILPSLFMSAATTW